MIIEVLDARDPLGCRCADVERFVRRVDPSKKVVLLLNKIGKHIHHRSVGAEEIDVLLLPAGGQVQKSSSLSTTPPISRTTPPFLSC